LTEYPWYSVADGEELQQGDILEDCRVFWPRTSNLDDPMDRLHFDWDQRDLIVMSQSCDLFQGREKIKDVLLCALWSRSELTMGHLSTAKGLEDARRGSLPAFHLLNAGTEPRFEREVRVVEFHRTYSLPIAYLRQRAASAPHLRLMPPYREHLSQAFARYFMRVGLPSDIPAFT
jgi:hypothetical protein